MALLALTFVQLYFGALVAGLRAGRVYNTWPEIDGAFIPSAARLWFEEPWWRNLFDNTLTVQFEHRMTAYALLMLAVLHAIDAMRSRAGSGRRSAARGGWWRRSSLQAALGILTLLHQVPIDLALAHQAVAIVVLTLAVLQTERLVARRVGAGPAETGSAARAARLKLNNSNLPAIPGSARFAGDFLLRAAFDAFVWGRTALLGWSER